MLQALILLELSGGVSVQEYARMVKELRERKVTRGREKSRSLYSPRGVLRVLGEKLGEEFTWSEADFDRAFMDLIELGCILLEGSTCSLSPQGRELLAANKTVALIQGRVAKEEEV